MANKENEFSQLKSYQSRKHGTILRQSRLKKNPNVVEKRACSSLVELSNGICQSQLPDNVTKAVASQFSLFSPWNHKKQDCNEESSRLRNKRSTLQVLDELKKGTHCYQRKNQYSSILGASYRHTTEPKQMVSKCPKALFINQSKALRQSYVDPAETASKSYTSQQVLHITHSLKDCSNELNHSQKKHKMKFLMPGHARIEYKPSCKENPRKENIKTSLLNKLAEGSWNRKAMPLKCSKKKHLKRMFTQSKNPQKTSQSSTCLSSGSVNFCFNKFTDSNPVSRTLLEKYLLVVNEQGSCR